MPRSTATRSGKHSPTRPLPITKPARKHRSYGDLIVGETKLYRNPEARREVVAQIIDYAKDLSALSYEKLDEAIRKAEAPDGNGGHPAAGLYETVAASPGQQELIEERFIDAVSRNLERGRFLLLVIGDGIQQGTENIAAFLQQHAGMHRLPRAAACSRSHQEHRPGHR
jgi:hypothetical protein